VPVFDRVFIRIELLQNRRYRRREQRTNEGRIARPLIETLDVIGQNGALLSDAAGWMRRWAGCDQGRCTSWGDHVVACDRPEKFAKGLCGYCKYTTFSQLNTWDERGSMVSRSHSLGTFVEPCTVMRVRFGTA
jgi:hypothetical protein